MTLNNTVYIVNITQQSFFRASITADNPLKYLSKLNALLTVQKDGLSHWSKKDSIKILDNIRGKPIETYLEKIYGEIYV
jgi:hypothetical protein